MSILSSIFLGLVQGISEFLPISSSGHLSLFQTFFGLTGTEDDMFFDVLLHLGTLISIFVYYRREIWSLIRELGRLIMTLFGSGGKERKRPDGGEREGRGSDARDRRRSGKSAGRKPGLTTESRVILMILVGTLPLFLVLPLKDKVESLYGNTLFIGCALIATGAILFFSDRMARGRKTARNATLLDALLVGVAQALAVVPGLSRSGTSISAGMLRGFQRTFAVRFSFLLSIPAVLGANIISIKDAVEAGIDPSRLPAYIVGAAVAAVSGYFAIRLVNILAGKGKFGSFAFYCWGVGAAALAATLIFR